MKVNEFFDAVYNCEITSNLEMLNYIQSITDDFENLKKDLLFHEYEDYLNKNIITALDSNVKFNEWTPENSQETNFHTLGFVIIHGEELVRDYKGKAQKKSKSIIPIIWIGKDESLRQFFESLKKKGLIEIRDTEEIIQEHFRQTDKKPQPIQWNKSNRLLIYLFNKLNEAGLVDTMDRQFQLITEHFKNKKGQALKADNLKSDSYNMKNFYTSDPKGSETIDRIIQELTD